MNVTINAIHFDASDKLVKFINRKISKIASHNSDVINIEVNLRVVKPETANNKEASVKVMFPDAPELYASKVADTFEEAIDVCVDALRKQIEKAKARIK